MFLYLINKENHNTISQQQCMLRRRSNCFRYISPMIFLPANKEEHNANSDVGEENAHPYLETEWIHERKDTGTLLHGLLKS